MTKYIFLISNDFLVIFKDAVTVRVLQTLKSSNNKLVIFLSKNNRKKRQKSVFETCMSLKNICLHKKLQKTAGCSVTFF